MGQLAERPESLARRPLLVNVKKLRDKSMITLVWTQWKSHGPFRTQAMTPKATVTISA